MEPQRQALPKKKRSFLKILLLLFILFLFLGVIVLTKVNNNTNQSLSNNQYPVPTQLITKYTSTAALNLVSKSPKQYSPKDLDKVTSVRTGGFIQGALSNEAKQKCLESVVQYVYAFPGYQYATIEGAARTGNLYNKNSNVYIHITGRGLIGSAAASEIGDTQGDSYTFELNYNNNKCQLLSAHVFHFLIPKEIYAEAVRQAKNSPSAENFLKTSQSISDHSLEWIDHNTVQFSNYETDYENIDFNKPAKGIILLEFESYQYHQKVYVDIFNNAVFSTNPIKIVPK